MERKIRMKKKFKLLKFIVIIAISIYVIITLINQQKILNSYKDTEKQLCMQIDEQLEYQDKLIVSSDNIHSEDYIEQIAREKLGMYKANERVYVNIGN